MMLRKLLSVALLLVFTGVHAAPYDLCLWCPSETESETCCPDSETSLPVHPECESCGCGFMQSAVAKHYPAVTATSDERSTGMVCPCHSFPNRTDESQTTEVYAAPSASFTSVPLYLKNSALLN